MVLKNEPLYPASRLVHDLKISDKYLRRILTTLSNSGLIQSVQGKHGGFKLMQKPDEISLFAIVMCVDDVEKYTGCVLGFPTCSDDHPCTLHSRWAPVRTELVAFLQTTSIRDVVKNPQILRY
ncbi:MAG: Rrf2 family transcriptional regulator [Bacteroidales bacterium]|nr:Rrf2 family transcriptional regulator [Bacteroidales bacterium]